MHRRTLLATAIAALVAGGRAGAQPAVTIVEALEMRGDFTRFLAGAGSVGLTEVLLGDGPFTVLAPPDVVFVGFRVIDLDARQTDRRRKRLTSILSYHVLPGRWPLADLEDGTDLDTVNGAGLSVQRDGGGVTLGGAQISDPDIAARNGLIHVIDRVLMPPDL